MPRCKDPIDPATLRSFMCGVSQKAFREIGCYPGQPWKESYKLIRKKFMIFPSDCRIIAKWIEDDGAPWPKHIVAHLSKSLLLNFNLSRGLDVFRKVTLKSPL